MDFEKEMQKSLKIIFQNIQALEDNRVRLPNKITGNDLLSRCNPKNEFKDTVHPRRRKLPPRVMPIVVRLGP